MSKFMNFSANIQNAFENDEKEYMNFSQLLRDASRGEFQSGITKADADEMIREKFRLIMGVDETATQKEIRRAIERNRQEIFEPEDRLSRFFADDFPRFGDGPPFGRPGDVDVMLFGNRRDIVDPGQPSQEKNRVGNRAVVGQTRTNLGRKTAERNLPQRGRSVEVGGDFGQEGTNPFGHFLRRFGRRGADDAVGVDRKTADRGAIPPTVVLASAVVLVVAVAAAAIIAAAVAAAAAAASVAAVVPAAVVAVIVLGEERRPRRHKDDGDEENAPPEEAAL